MPFFDIMLQAILHSKVGSQFKNLTEDTHCREVSSTHKDFLTAALFRKISLFGFRPSLENY